MDAAQWQSFFNQTVQQGLMPANRASQRRIEEIESQKDIQRKLDAYRQEIELKMQLAPLQAEAQRKLEAAKLGLPETATWEEVFKRGQEVRLRESLAPAQYRAMQEASVRSAQTEALKQAMKPDSYYLQKAYEQLPLENKRNPSFDVARSKLSPEELSEVSALAGELMQADQKRAIAAAALVGPSPEEITRITDSVVTGQPYIPTGNQATGPQAGGIDSFLDDVEQEISSRDALTGDEEEWRGLIPMIASVPSKIGQYYENRPGTWQSNLAAQAYFPRIAPFAADTLAYTLFGETPIAESVYGAEVYQPTPKEEYAAALMGKVRSGEITQGMAMEAYNRRFPR